LKENTENTTEKTFNYAQLFKIARGTDFGDDVKDSRYKYFKKRTNEILSNLNFDVKEYKKDNKYYFPTDISAIIIVIEIDDGNKQENLLYKIKNYMYSDITGKDILIFLYKSILVKEVLNDNNNKSLDDMHKAIVDLTERKRYYNPNPTAYEQQFNMNESHSFNILLQYANILNFPTLIQNNLKSDLDELVSCVYAPKTGDLEQQNILKSLRLIEMKGSLCGNDVYNIFDELNYNLRTLLYFYILQVKIFHLLQADASFINSLDEKNRDSSFMIKILKCYVKVQLDETPREFIEKLEMPSVNELADHFKKIYPNIIENNTPIRKSDVLIP
jgi:hypothetical protein